MRVNAHEQGPWLARRATQHGTTRARTEIDCHSLEASGQLLDLADVYVDQLLADYLAHRRKVRRSVTLTSDQSPRPRGICRLLIAR